MGATVIIPSERLRSGAPSAYGSIGYEVVRDGWSVAVFRAVRGRNPRGELLAPTPEALEIAKADARRFAASDDLLAALKYVILTFDPHDIDSDLDGARASIALAEGHAS